MIADTRRVPVRHGHVKLGSRCISAMTDKSEGFDSPVLTG